LYLVDGHFVLRACRDRSIGDIERFRVFLRVKIYSLVNRSNFLPYARIPFFDRTFVTLILNNRRHYCGMSQIQTIEYQHMSMFNWFGVLEKASTTT